MADNVKNLVLEPLRLFRNDIKTLSQRMDDQFQGIRLRLGSMETQLSTLQREVAGLHGDIAILHGRMDLIETRLDRIERRLELREEV